MALLYAFKPAAVIHTQADTACGFANNGSALQQRVPAVAVLISLQAFRRHTVALLCRTHF